MLPSLSLSLFLSLPFVQHCLNKEQELETKLVSMQEAVNAAHILAKESMIVRDISTHHCYCYCCCCSMMHQFLLLGYSEGRRALVSTGDAGEPAPRVFQEDGRG